MSQPTCSASTAGRDWTYQSTDGLTLHYVDFPSNGGGVPVLCLHGMSRNTRDFSDLAAHLQTSRRVVCTDFRGRGLSDWDPDLSHYEAPIYVADVLTLMTQVGLDRVIVIGTSLGGIVGTGMVKLNSDLVAGIVLNDIGPIVDPAGLARIGSYIGKGALWSSWNEAAETVKEANAAIYPDFRDDDWLDFVHKTCRQKEDGTVVQDYDPAIAQGFADNRVSDLDLWPLFETLKSIPALLLRGALSDLLSVKTATEMTKRLPDLDLVTVANRGHVPTLNEPDTLSAIEAFVAKVDILEAELTEWKQNSHD